MEDKRKSKEKIHKMVTIFENSSDEPFKWKDIKHIKFQDEDLIRSEYVPAYYSENNSWDEHFEVYVEREVLETEKEYQDRLKGLELEEKWAKERRLQTYNKLKKEFENEKV